MTTWADVDALKERHYLASSAHAWLSLGVRGIKNQKPFAQVTLTETGKTCNVRWDGERRELVFSLVVRKPHLCRAVSLSRVLAARDVIAITTRAKKNSWGVLLPSDCALLVERLKAAFPKAVRS